MGQIPRSTERISSIGNIFHKQYWYLYFFARVLIVIGIDNSFHKYR